MKPRHLFIQVVAMLVSTIAMAAGIGILFGLVPMSNWSMGTGMALPTAVSFLLISLCIWLLAERQK